VRKLVECVANFSEGRDAAVIDSIAEAISRGAGAAVLHRTSDPDHNRSVITFAGTPDGVAAAAVRAVAKASELIDLNSHVGVHPRLGAADVVPLVPLEGTTIDECVALAHRVGDEIWSMHRIPVYFYEAAALIPGRERLENVRRGGFEGIRDALATDLTRRPDVGGPDLHETAGAVIVGARKFLIAWNVNLASTNLEAARSIARKIRQSSGGLPAVKALGLRLESRGQVQVSVNLTDFELTPLHRVFQEISTEASSLGIEIAGTEIIGLIPRAALEAAAEAHMRFENFAPSVVVERRIDEVLPPGFGDLLEQLADPSRSMGGGAAAAAAGAMAASLSELMCRLTRRDPDSFRAHRAFFAEAISKDAEAFAALMRTSEPSPDAVIRATEVPVAIAERAHKMYEDISLMSDHISDQYLSDLQTAFLLARAARDGAIATARMNLVRIRQDMIRKELEERMWTIQ
jgi:glutamate formiminotransferase